MPETKMRTGRHNEKKGLSQLRLTRKLVHKAAGSPGTSTRDMKGNKACNDFEIERQRCIERNNKLLEELGVPKCVERLVQPSRPAKVYAARSPKPVLSPSRRSNRIQNQPVPVYNEDISKLDGQLAKRPRWQSRAASAKEQYNMQQLDSLGDHTKEWQLFQDGYVNGKRVYERDIGLTCHQCRQKTLGKRTHCSKCKSRRGQFCGDCLWMRYGENVEESNANQHWRCPVCRDICNCSFCRSRKGWAPTGVMYQRVKGQGFKSVAHYLVLTHLDVSVETGDGTNKGSELQQLETVQEDQEQQAPRVESDDSENTKQLENLSEEKRGLRRSARHKRKAS